MDIRLKNKNIYLPVLIVSIYMLAVSMFSAFDFIRYRAYIGENPYFNSTSYIIDLKEYFDIVKTHITESRTAALKGSTQASDLNVLERNIEARGFVSYYIKDKSTGEVFTNLETSSNIDEYISKKAIYVETFPQKLTYDYNKNDYYKRNINNWFQSNNFEGSFIFVKSIEGSSQMEVNYTYYNSIRERVLKEGILFIITTIIGLAGFIYLNIKTREPVLYFNKVEFLYERLPVDLILTLLIIYSLVMLTYFRDTVIFYKPLDARQFFMLTFAAVYIFYLLTSVWYFAKFSRNTGMARKKWDESLTMKIIYLLHDSLMIKSMMFKAGGIFILTTIFGIFIFIGLYGMRRHIAFYTGTAALYIFIYLFTVPLYSIRRINSLAKILKGTEEITSGNLDYIIEEKEGNNLSRLAQNINNMKEGFKKSVDSQLKSERLKTELITNVSHDLKTPLTSIINFISLLKKAGISEEQRNSYVEVLEQKSQRLKILIEDLFEASKMSSGAVELNIDKVDIASLLRQALGEFDERINNSTLSFRVNIPVEEVNLQLDGKKTWRVFENLIGNALKYSQKNSRVYIDMLEHPDKVQVIIKNMSAYEMDFDVEEIFERFKRGDKARSSEGSGLGLSIAKSIVEIQGGRMRIDIDGDLFKVIVEFKK